MKKRLILVFLILLAGFVYAQDCYNVLNPISIPSSGTSLNGHPSIAWNGNEYGVVWHGFKNNIWSMYFTKFDTNGNKIGSDIKIKDDAFSPSIAWNGNEYGIIWKSPRVGSQYIYFARFDSNGGQKGSAFRISSFTSYTEGASFLTTEGNKFSISWTRYIDASNNLELYLTIIDRINTMTTTKIGKTTQEASFKYVNPFVWNGNEYGIKWMNYTTTPQYWNAVYFTRFNSIGQRAGENNLMASSGDYLSLGYPSLVWNGNEYGAVYTNNSEIYFVRISSNGLITEPSKKVSIRPVGSFSYLSPSLAWNGSVYGVSWIDYYTGKGYFTSIESSGNRISSIINLSYMNYYTDEDKLPVLFSNGNNGYGIVYIYSNNAYLTMIKPVSCPVPVCSPDGITQQCGITDAGECSYGTQTCVSGAWDQCVGDVGPATETCDSLDNDCNNVVDDIQDLNSLQDGVCAGSTMKCIDGVASDYYSTVTDYESTETICDDALDNDCDGLADADDGDCIAVDCSECNGVTCSSTDCHTIIGDCYFVSGLIGGDCFNTVDATSCSDFGNDDLACNNNAVHGLGCSYNSVDEICEESGILCGNGNLDTGENCLTCQEDAGCGSDPSKPYCQSSGLCGASADPTLADDDDWVCEAGETCGVNDCAGEQAGCAFGYICNVDGIGGCVVDDEMINPNQLDCEDDLEGVECLPTDAYNEPQYCISIWNGGLPYIQTIQTSDTYNCCLTGQCGATDTGTGVTGQVRLLSRKNCIPIGEGVEGSMQITTTVYENGQVIGTPETTQETCYISKKIQLPFYNFISIFMTLVILIGFYLRFSKQRKI